MKYPNLATNNAFPIPTTRDIGIVDGNFLDQQS